jgi:hypothetical protein
MISAPISLLLSSTLADPPYSGANEISVKFSRLRVTS